MWEPKLPLALSSERGNFGSHMLLLPRTDFYFFVRRDVTFFFAPARFSLQNTWERGRGKSRCDLVPEGKTFAAAPFFFLEPCYLRPGLNQNVHSFAYQTKKDVLGRDNMWEPKLPLALSSERGNFGSHMLLLPRTDFYFFVRRDVTFFFAPARFSLQNTWERGCGKPFAQQI